MREKGKAMKLGMTATGLAALVVLVACAPTVKVQGGGEPIVINLNVKIEQEVRIKVEKDIEDLIKSEPGLF